MIRKTILYFLFTLGACYNLAAQCAGLDFAATSTTGCAPFITKFNALNFPAGSEFSWDMGDGNYSSQSAADSFVTNVFTVPGQYTIKLRVYLQGGVICPLVKNNYITVGSKPTAAFFIDKTLLCHGSDTVTFSDLTPKSQSRDWIIDGVFYYNTPKDLKVFISS